MLAGGFRNGSKSVIILTRDAGSMAFDLSSNYQEAGSTVFAGACEECKDFLTMPRE